MRLFNKDEEKRSVGRPKLACDETKKKAIISICVCLVLVLALLLTGAFKLNVINFNKLKGTVNVNLCSEIPARYQPRSESNPEGTYEYGFTDPKFYSAVVSTYNSDATYCSTITEEQLKSITNLEVYSINIDNADGIQYLTELKKLQVTGNSWSYIGGGGNGNLTSIDVSKNTALTTLDLSSNKLSSIDVNQNTALTSLYLSGNILSSIDVSQNIALTSLYLSYNNLTNIDVSQNISLINLELIYNNLSSIDVSYNTALKTLYLSDNNLSSIDLSKNTALTSLYLSRNILSSIDVSQNAALTNLNLNSNKLNSIDLSQNAALTNLNLNSNKLNSIDLNNNPDLNELMLSNNSLSSIDVSNNTKLTSLSASVSNLNSVDNIIGIENIKSQLKYLSVSYSNLTEINPSEFPNLTTLNLYHNNLSSIDVSQNVALKELDLGDNSLSSIDLSTNTILTRLELYNNNLSSINVSQNPVLTTLDLSRNKLSNIDVSKNTALTYLNLYDNNFDKRYSSIDKNITIEKPSVITAYPNDTQYNIENPSIATYDDGVVEMVTPGNTKLNITYKVSNSKTFTVNYDINFIGITSSYYTIDNENKTIDAKGEVLNNINTWSFSITPYGYSLNKNNDKLEIKDSSGNVIDTYTLKNYALYKLQSSLYTINDEEKTIDANNNLAHYSYILISPSEFRINQNNDKLEIKDSSGNVIDTYKFINYSKYKLNSSTYTIDDNNKTIDAKGNIFAINNIWINSSGQYDRRQNENIIEILDSDKNVVDSYEIINERQKDEDAYLKAGFKDKNLYAWVVACFVGIDGFEEVPMYKDYLLTEEEIQSITGFVVVNQDITDTTGLEKLTNLIDIALINTNIESIDLSKYSELYTLVIRNGRLTSLDVSKNTNLQYIDVAYNNISKITGLDKLEGLYALIAYNNNLSNLYVSKTTNLELLMVSNNPLSNTLYMLKGKEIDYKKDFKLNEAYDIKYDVVDTNVVTYKVNKLKALKEGISNIYLSNENIYVYKPELWDKNIACNYLFDQKACEEIENINEEEALLPYLINQEIKVYDITSKEYKIDKDKKTIDALNKDFDASKINLTLNGLTGTLEDDKFIIKDKEVIVDTYTVTNIKKVIKEEVVSDSSNGTKVKPSDKVIEKLEERKEKAEEKLEDIIIEGKNVSLATLLLVKGKDRNIVVKQDGMTITINGKDIDKVTGNLDLGYELKVLKESIIYNEVKDKVNNGIVLSFKSNSNLPGKVLISIDVTDTIKKNAGTKNLRLYGYKNGELTLVADKINLNNNKLSFYINKLGNYVLTNNEINKKNVDIDSSMYKENNELSKDISNKKLIIPIVIFILLIILGIIGYVRYKKNKDKND